MSNIAKIVGQRIRFFRLQTGLSQEKLAELSDCHPTYIGQVERGEKNATLESVERIANALNVPLANFFDKIELNSLNYYPSKCYEFLLSKSKVEQEQLYKIILEIDKYKSSSK